MSLRLLSYNIRYGGVNRERQLAAVISACAPDVAILQEATRPDVVERLAGLCGLPHWGAEPGDSVAFLSARPVASHAWRKSPLARRRFLEMTLEGSAVRLFGLHLSAIHSNPTERRRAYELRALLRSIEPQRKGFHLLVGDFNTLAPGERLDIRKLPLRLRMIVYLTGRTIRWSTIKLMLDAGYADVYRAFHKDDEGYTFPTWDPHVRLDYCFVPAISAPRVSRCEIVRNAPGVAEASDHFPLLIELDDTPA